MPMTYPTEFKIKAVRRYENGESIKDLCQELDISQSTLYHWRKQYCTIQTAIRSYTPAEFDAIAKRLKKLEHMLEIIRLSGFLARVPLQEKLPLLEHLHNEMGDFYSVKELCEALEVARGTFYSHIFRRADPQKYQDEKMQFMLRIKQIFDDSEQRYGASKIRAVLAGTGQQVSTKRVSSIMQELGLQSVRTDAKKFYIKLQHRKKRNLLQRHFTADRPNQVWVSDITYFKINNPRVYLCTIIDLFSRRVVGYRIFHSASTRLVTTTFRKAYAKRGNPTELTFHSDRGGQYISDTFSKLLQNCHVKQSFSASGCPYDNAAAESFFATFKKEEAYRREYTSERHFQKCVEDIFSFTMRSAPIKHWIIRRRKHLKTHMKGIISESSVHIATLIKENIFTIFMFAQDPL